MPTRFDLIYGLAAPLALPYFGWRAWRTGKYRESAGAMMGRRLPDPAAFRGGSLWVHAVSVGETVAARSITRFKDDLAPGLPLVVTTVTETGQAHARRTIPEADCVHYFPLDFSANVRRFQACFNPRVFIMMETELWPNFLHGAAARGTRVFMANGKLSDKSFRGYRRFRALLAPAFDAIEVFCMQTEADAERMRDLSGRPADVFVTGNCKFDVPAEPLTETQAQERLGRWRLGAPERPRLVVGSTHPGEEAIMLEAFREARKAVPALQLILSPRHPERFEATVELCRAHGAGWRVSRASAPWEANPDVFVLDTMGELAAVYGLGGVAVVAGSFSKIGGHNLLEAAAHSVPVVVGPHMHAQKEIDRLFRGPESGCVRTGAETLGATLADLFADDAKRRRIGAQALATARANQGSARRTVDIFRERLDQSPAS